MMAIEEVDLHLYTSPCIPNPNLDAGRTSRGLHLDHEPSIASSGTVGHPVLADTRWNFADNVS